MNFTHLRSSQKQEQQGTLMSRAGDVNNMYDVNNKHSDFKSQHERTQNLQYQKISKNFYDAIEEIDEKSYFCQRQLLLWQKEKVKRQLFQKQL